MPVKPPGPHDTAMVLSAGNATSAARAIRAIIGASAVAWPCEVAMISCAGGRPAPAPGSSSATEQADPDVSIASIGAVTEVEAAFIEWLTCARRLPCGLCGGVQVC